MCVCQFLLVYVFNIAALANSYTHTLADEHRRASQGAQGFRSVTGVINMDVQRNKGFDLRFNLVCFTVCLFFFLSLTFTSVFL